MDKTQSEEEVNIEIQNFQYFYHKYKVVVSQCHCKHNFSIAENETIEKNMLCKYKFVLMNNKYNLYFNSFTKEYPLILSSLNLTQKKSSWNLTRKKSY